MAQIVGREIVDWTYSHEKFYGGFTPKQEI